MRHHTDEVLLRFATPLMWASLALALGIGLGFAWRSVRLADEGVEIQARVPLVEKTR